MKALGKANEVRKILAEKCTVKLSHGEHVTHAAYMGGTAFLSHEIVAHIAGIVFFLIMVNFILNGLHETE